MPYRKSLSQGGDSAYILASNAGKDGQIIFRGSADYDHFMVLIKQLVRSNDTVDIVGFALLQGSFYLLFHEGERGSAAKLIQRLSISYSIYSNAKYTKTGKVFRGPYKDALLSSDDQIMQALCTVHRLPALQQENPETYEWSSYHYYLTRRGTWLHKSFVETYFATTKYQNDLRHMTATVPPTRLL